MNQPIPVAPLGALVVLIFALLTILSIPTSRWMLGESITFTWTRWRRLGWALLAGIAGALTIVQRIFQLPREIYPPPQFGGYSHDDPITQFSSVAGVGMELLCRGLTVLLAFFLAAKLYEKWINRRLSDAEQSHEPGVSLRAWLGGPNLAMALLLAVCAWQGFDASFWFILIVTVGALAAYPLLKMLTESRPPIPVVPAAESLSPERERVLRLLEAGKITAEESAELLAALAATVPPPPPPLPTIEPWTPTRKLVMIGAALVLIGFFLPWFKVNPAAEAQKVMAAMQQSMGNMMPGGPTPNFNFKVNGVDMNPGNSAGAEISVTGGEIGRGLGWIILVLGLGAASVPYVATGLRRETRWKVMLTGVAVALIIAVYLVTESPRLVSVGLPVVLVGLVLEGVAIVREREPAARHGFPVIAPIAV